MHDVHVREVRGTTTRDSYHHFQTDLERKLSAIAKAEEASVSVSVHSRQLKLKASRTS